jgi:hypothetical protein
MRQFLVLALLIPLPSLASGRQDEKEPPKDTIAVGKDLPAPLNPFNITGASKRRFHDPIGPHGLDPFVLFFTNDTEFSDDLKKALQSVDTVIEKNPASRIGSCAVFFSPTVTSVLTDDDAREELAIKLDSLAKDLMLKHVILAIDSPDNVPKYKAFTTGTRALFLHKLRVQGIFGGDKLPPEETGKLLAAIAEKAGAKRK